MYLFKSNFISFLKAGDLKKNIFTIAKGKVTQLASSNIFILYI